jgi:hypothetical protein
MTAPEAGTPPMGMETHTPGPWHVTLTRSTYGHMVHGPLMGPRDEGDHVCNAFGEPNARLIAAAPDLLAALKAAPDPGGFDHTAPEFWFRRYKAWQIAARDAIARATGTDTQPIGGTSDELDR